MITVYAAKESDYSTNGLMPLDRHCMAATITEKRNGEYRLHMELAINERTVTLAPEMVVKVPAPVRFTPALNIYEESPTKIYKIVTSGMRLNLRTRPDLEKGKVLHAYKNGTEVIVTDDTSHDDWYAVAAPDGRSGWMWAENLEYVRTENAAPVSTGTVREQTAREQLFRISSVNDTLDCIEIDAWHISYDLRRNYVGAVSVKSKTGAEALAAVLEAAVTPHEFTAHSDVQTLIGEDIGRRSPMAAILSDGGLIEQAGGVLLRDNFDLYWSERIGQDRGVTIAYRKNMAGMEVRMDTSELVTRIIPVGFDKKGNAIIGDAVDSPHINEYAQPYTVEYEYKDVTVGKNGFADEAAVRAELAKRAAAEYDAGIDVPQVTASVDYADVGDRSFAGVFLGDTVRIRHEDYGMDFAAEVAAYEWDCLRNEYIGVEMGSRPAQLSDVRISPSQIGNGTLPGRKLAAGTVSGAELGEGVITDEHVNISGIAGEKIIGAVSGVDTKTGIRINENGVYISGGEVDLRTNDGAQYLNITPECVEASEVRSPTVAPRYAGMTVLTVDPNATIEQMQAWGVYRSLSDALTALSHRQIDGKVSVNIADGAVLYGDAVLAGVCGGEIEINAANVTLNGSLMLDKCSCKVQISGLKMVGTNEALKVNSCTYVGLWACTLASDSTDAMLVTEGARAYVTDCTLIAPEGSAAFVSKSAFASFVNCMGTGALGAQDAQMVARGAVPDGGCVDWGGALIHAEGVTPTPAESEAPSSGILQTAHYPMTHSDSYAGSSVSSWSWFDDADIRQGITGNSGRIYGCMWFDAAQIQSELGTKTIQQASLRLKMQSGYGRGVAVAVQLYGTNMEYNGRTGAPTLVTEYGTIGSTNPGEVNTITIPNRVAEDLAAGVICALVLRSDDTEKYNGRAYSKNYARFDGQTNGTEESAPMLTVVYE